jgi:hypothetical protein
MPAGICAFGREKTVTVGLSNLVSIGAIRDSFQRVPQRKFSQRTENIAPRVMACNMLVEGNALVSVTGTNRWRAETNTQTFSK